MDVKNLPISQEHVKFITSSTIVSYNNDKRSNSLVKNLKDIIYRFNPMLIMLQDLPSNFNLTKVKKILNHRYNHLTNPRKDMAILLYETLNFEPIDNNITVNSHFVACNQIESFHQQSNPDQSQRPTNHRSKSSCKIRALGCRFEAKPGKWFNIFNIYIRPRATHSDVGSLLNWIVRAAQEKHGLGKSIIMGDTNSSSFEWDPEFSKTKNRKLRSFETSIKHYDQIKLIRGKLISNFISKHKLICLNRFDEGPTYYDPQYKNESFIDIALIGEKAYRKWQEFKVETMKLNFLHKCIVIKPVINDHHTDDDNVDDGASVDSLTLDQTNYFEENHVSQENSYRQQIYYYPISKMNAQMFDEFKIENNNLIYNWKNLDTNKLYQRIDNLSENIIKCLQNIQSTIGKRRNKIHGGFLKTDNCLQVNRKCRIIKTKMISNHYDLIKLRNAIKTCSHSRSVAYKIKVNQGRYYNRLSSFIRMLISANQRRQQFEQEQYDWEKNDNKDLRFKGNIELRKSVIDNSSSSMSTRQLERCEISKADYYREDPVLIDVADNDDDNCYWAGDRIRILDKVEHLALSKFPFIERNALTDWHRKKPTVAGITNLDRSEVEIAMKELRKKTHSGIDGVTHKIFCKSYEFLGRHINALCKMVFYATKIPECCQVSLGKLIPKKESGKFRVIHLSNPLSSLIELIALHRLQYDMDILNLFSKYQFAFTALTDRHDLMARIIKSVVDNRKILKEKARTCLISLDIEGAFDNISHDALYKIVIDLLQDSQIKNWLIEFILNRKIVIDLDGVRSSVKSVCKGVPQGSSLGPILWNLAIYKMLEQLNATNTSDCLMQTMINYEQRGLSVLAYADDIFIVHNMMNINNSPILIQRKIYQVEMFLGELNLKLNENKCKCIMINNNRIKNYSVSNESSIVGVKFYAGSMCLEPIEQVDSMNVLGMQVTDRLKLDCRMAEKSDNLTKNIRQLYTLNRIKIIKDPECWRQLFDSYIVSIIVVNNLPLLAHDKTSRAWAQRQLTNAACTIFRWPTNVACKLVRLILKLCGIDLMVAKLISSKMLTRLDKKTAQVYMDLYEQLNLQCLPHISILKSKLNANKLWSCCVRQKQIKNGDNTTISTKIRRRYHDPCLSFTLNDNRYVLKRYQYLVDRKNKQANERVWLFMEHRYGTVFVETNLRGDRVFSKQIGRHSGYSINYFNTISMLWNLIEQQQQQRDQSIIQHTKLILFNERNPLLMAMMNQGNHDWRIIMLKEKLIKQGFKFFIVKSNRFMERICDRVMKCILYDDQNQAQQLGHKTCHYVNYNFRDCKLLEWPPVDDYVCRYLINKAYRITLEKDLQLNHTTVTQAIDSNSDHWSNLNPTGISSAVMLALTGLIHDSSKQLTSGKRESGSNPDGCNHEIGCRINQCCPHVAIHRMLECSRYKEDRLNVESRMIEYLQDKSFKLNIRGLRIASGGYKTNEQYLLRCFLARRELFQFLLRCSFGDTFIID